MKFLNDYRFFLLFFCSLFLLISSITSSEPRKIPLNDSLPIIDSFDESGILPSGFRMTKRLVLPSGEKLNLTGLGKLNISGSAQFSKQGLEAVVKRVGKKSFTLVNLRDIEVCFVEPEKGSGGFPFSYLNNSGNRSAEEIEASAELKIHEIRKHKTFTLYGMNHPSTPADQRKILYKTHIVVKRALTEKQLANEKGLGYVRIPLKKFSQADYGQIDQFVFFVQNLPSDHWVHFHSGNGLFRSTVFMIMFDMMRNADKVSAKEIIERQGPLGLGGADLLALNKQDNYYALKKGWHNFLLHFHKYAKENKKDGFEKSWSLWADEMDIPEITSTNIIEKTKISSTLPEENDVYREKIFIVNTVHDSKLPVQNFRTSHDLWLDDEVIFNKTGIGQFNSSGSTQYTKHNLKPLITKLKTKAQNVVIVDLRPDNHVFVNGMDLSTFETKDALLKSKTPEEINASRVELKKLILSKKGIEAHVIDTKYPRNVYDHRLSLVLSPEEVETPQELVTNLGANYLLIGNNRFSEISDENIDQMIAYMRTMPKNTWYHFHCKKGNTRTTLFLTIFDIMHNADKASMEDIIARQKIMGGTNMLDVTAKNVAWKDEKASKKQWIEFLARFHRYVIENKFSNFIKPWSQWSQENANYLPNIEHIVIDKNIKK
jgi:hypothetical protein